MRHLPGFPSPIGAPRAGANITITQDALGWIIAAAAGGGGGGAPGSGPFQLVEEKVFGAAATSYTFNNLDGDTDVIYQIVYRILDAVGGTFFTLRPNGVTTNQLTKRHYYGSFAGAGTDTSTLALCDPNAFASGSVNDVFTGIGWLSAKTGLERQFRNLMDWHRENDNALFGGMLTSRWDEAATNITSLELVADQASAIGVGSYVRIYKLLAEALALPWERTFMMMGA